MSWSAHHRRRFELVLGAAADVARVERAYDAEVLVSALLGSVYAVAEGDRAPAVADFAADLRLYLARRRTPDAALLRHALAAFVAGGRRPAHGPPWTAWVGTARPTGTYADADEYGDQTSYVATFAYPDELAGGPEHAVVALVDHNLGFARDPPGSTREARHHARRAVRRPGLARHRSGVERGGVGRAGHPVPTGGRAVRAAGRDPADHAPDVAR